MANNQHVKKLEGSYISGIRNDLFYFYKHAFIDETKQQEAFSKYLKSNCTNLLSYPGSKGYACFSYINKNEIKGTDFTFYLRIRKEFRDNFEHYCLVFNTLWPNTFEVIQTSDYCIVYKITVKKLHSYSELMVIGNILRIWGESPLFVVKLGLNKKRIEHPDDLYYLCKQNESLCLCYNIVNGNHFSFHTITAKSFSNLKQFFDSTPLDCYIQTGWSYDGRHSVKSI